MNWKQSIVKNILLLIYFTDQGLRVKLQSVKSSLARRILWYSIKTLDILNIAIVNQILKRFGWPIKSVFGEKASLTAYYVIMHSNERTITKYIKLLSQAANDGEADCQHLANMIDRLLKYRKKKQIYGNAIRGLRVNGEMSFFIYPIVNRKKVNERRRRIGLNQTIEEYAKANNAILDYGDDIFKRLTQYPCN
jgi:hypothetical protein